MKELSSAKHEAEVSQATVAEVLQKLLFESQGVLNQFFLKLISPWTRPNSHGSHILILTQLAKGTNKLKEISAAINRSQRETSSQIQELIEQELIIKTGVFYRFHNKIFKFWLRDVYERRELLLLGTTAKAEDFITRIHGLIAEYEELLKIDAADRVVSLFTLFKNEIVEFGEKRRKLPHFTEFIQTDPKAPAPRGSSRSVIAKGHGRCWVCKIVEERATEREVLELVKGCDAKSASPTKVLVALKGLDENAKLLAKEKRVFTLGLSRINMLMDIYGHSPIVNVDSARAHATTPVG